MLLEGDSLKTSPVTRPISHSKDWNVGSQITNIGVAAADTPDTPAKMDEREIQHASIKAGSFAQPVGEMRRLLPMAHNALAMKIIQRKIINGRGIRMSQSRKSGRKIRYAVVGLGHLAQVAVLPAFKKAQNSELVAIVSEDAEKREKVAKKYGLDQSYSDDAYEKALFSVDVVYIALPNHLHREYAVRAAFGGLT